MLNVAESDADDDVAESEIAQLLECHYGDSMVYLPRTKPRHLLSIAVKQGFIDDEGYLTRKGRMLLARYF